jgi:hypothetical protein
MPLWVENSPMFYSRHLVTRDLAKVTTLGIARLAYIILDEEGGEALSDWNDRHYDDSAGARPTLQGTDHGTHIERQRRFWNSGDWVPFFVRFMRIQLGL